MRMTYDATADAAYLYLVDEIAPGAAVETRLADVPLKDSVFAFDFDVDGKLLGIEILGALRVLPAETLRRAE